MGHFMPKQLSFFISYNNRSAQVEGAFGVVKQDMDYDRVRRRGLDKITNKSVKKKSVNQIAKSMAKNKNTLQLRCKEIKK